MPYIQCNMISHLCADRLYKTTEWADSGQKVDRMRLCLFGRRRHPVSCSVSCNDGKSCRLLSANVTRVSTVLRWDVLHHINRIFFPKSLTVPFFRPHTQTYHSGPEDTNSLGHTNIVYTFNVVSTPSQWCELFKFTLDRSLVYTF